jgi:hypothetical protein
MKKCYQAIAAARIVSNNSNLQSSIKTLKTVAGATISNGNATSGGEIEIESFCDGLPAINVLKGDVPGCEDWMKEGQGLSRLNHIGGIGAAGQAGTTHLAAATPTDSACNCLASKTSTAVLNNDQFIGGTTNKFIGKVWVKQLTVTKNADSAHVITGGFRLSIKVVAADSTHATSGVLDLADPAAGITTGVWKGGDPEIGSTSLCKELKAIYASSAAQAYTFGAGSSTTGVANPGDYACYANATTNSATAVEVAMVFPTNWRRMQVYHHLKNKDVKSDGNPQTGNFAMSTASGPGVSNIDSAADLFLYNDSGVKLASPAAYFTAKLEMECQSTRASYGSVKSVEDDVMQEFLVAGALPQSITGTYEASGKSSFIAMFWSDEEVFRAARRLFLANGSTKCASWKPMKVSCAKCDALAGTTAVSDHVPGVYQWTLAKGKTATQTFVAATTPSNYTAAGTYHNVNHSACNAADNIGAAGVKGRVVYCEVVTDGASAYKATVKLAWVTPRDTRRANLAIGAVAAVDAVTLSTGDTCNKAGTGFFPLEYTLTLSDVTTETDTVSLGPGRPAQTGSACAKFTHARVISCTSGAKGAGKMTMYFETAADREAAAKAAVSTVTSGVEGVLSIKPSGPASITFRTATYVIANKSSVGADVNFTNATHDNPAASGHYNPTGTACADAGLTNAIYCKSLKDVGSKMEVMWLGDSAAVTTEMRNLTKKSTGKSGEEVLKYKVSKPLKDITPKLYTVTYALTKGTVPIVKGDVASNTFVANSGCNFAYAASNKIVHCVSDTKSVTVAWVSAGDRFNGARAVGIAAATDAIKMIQPTGSVDGPLDTKDAGSLTSVTFVQHNGTGAKPWGAAALGRYDAGTSACEAASDAAVTTKIIFCDSEKASGTDMPLIWLTTADARTDFATLQAKKTDGGEGALKETAFAVPKANTLYTVAFTLGQKTAVAPATPPLIVAGNGCTFVGAANWDVSCVSTPNLVTAYYLTATLRDTKAAAIAIKGPSGNVGTVQINASGTKDKAAANKLITVKYDVTPTADVAWVASGKYPKTSESACLKMNAANIVYCNSPKSSAKGKAVTATLKYLTTANNVYIASLKALAGSENTHGDAKSTPYFVLQQQAAVTEAVFTMKPTTTVAPTGRRLAVGDVAATGRFDVENSWCKAAASTATSAIYCGSDKAGKVTLSYLDADLGVADANSICKMTAYDATSASAFTATMKLQWKGTTEVPKNSLCDHLSAPTKGKMTSLICCSHDKISAVTTRRALQDATTAAPTRAVTVKAAFLSEADAKKAQVAFNAVKWSTATWAEVASGSVTLGGVKSAVPVATTSTDTTTKSAATTPSTTPPKTPTGTPTTTAAPSPTTTDAAALRLVGVVAAVLCAALV